MDFQSMKRRELQALCKLNNIPANLTNAAMADALSNLPSVEGLDEFLGQPGVEVEGSPERSTITSTVPRTSTRRTVTRKDIEGSKMTIRTRCGTRRHVVERTDTKKTPATRTTQRKASKEASVQKQMQAEFEAEMKQSETSENSVLSGGELKEISEEVSKAVLEDNLSLESQNKSQSEPHPAVNEEHENIDGDTVSVNQADDNENSSGSRMVDFHSLSRRDLQGLCKKNKIPANTTNAMMADALGSLNIVEGLAEFLQNCDTQAPGSPEMSEITSSCARRTWTSRRVTKEPTSSKMMAKSCCGSRRKVIAEEIEQTNNTDSKTLAAPNTWKSELQTYNRRESHKSAVKECEGKSSMKDNVAEMEGSVSENSAVNGLIQVEHADIESGKSIDFPHNDTKLEDVSSKGNKLVKCEFSKTPKGLLNDEDALLPEDARVGGSETPEQQVHNEVISDDTSLEGSIDGEKFSEVESETTLSEVLVSTVSENAQVGELISIDSAEIEGGAIDDNKSVQSSENSEDFNKVVYKSNTKITPLEKMTSNGSAEIKDGTNDDDASVEGSENIDFSETEPESDRDIISPKEVAFADSAEIEDGANDDDTSVEGSENIYFSEGESESYREVISPKEVTFVDSAEIEDGASDDDTRVEGSENTDFSEGESGSDIEIIPSKEVIFADSAETGDGTSDGDMSVEGTEEIRDFSKVESESDEEIIPPKEVISAQIKLVEEYDIDSCSESSESDEVFSETGSGSISSVVLCLSANPDAWNNQESESESMLLKELVTTDSAAQEVPNLGTLETGYANNQREKVVTFSDLTPSYSLTEKLESVEEKLSITDSTFVGDHVVPKEKETPLNNKSLRKLKRMLKEKLQGTTTLDKKMEALTLENDGIPQAEEGKSSELKGFDVKAALCPVSILLDNELVSQSSAAGDINVECYQEVEENHVLPIPAKSSSTMKLNPVLSTPSKSATKTPKSASRISVADINKENIDHSACKTESAKINLVTGSGKLFSAMSMGKLKKEFKSLQHSEKKRQALQVHPENGHQLASP